MDVPRTLADNPHIIVFDGVCNLCAGWVKFVCQRDHAGRFRFVSMQSETGRALLQWAGVSPDNVDTMLYVEQGQAYTRSTAFLKIIRHFPAGWPLLAWGIYVPAPLRDFLYNRIANNRYRLFGRRDHCLVPDAAWATRFL